MHFRKLYSLTCADEHKKQSLEKKYPGLCGEVTAVMEAGSCEDRWTKEGLGGDEARIDKFQENILSYMEENIALINIYLKEPYCEVILQDIYMTW